MTTADLVPTIRRVEAILPTGLCLQWSDGKETTVDIAPWLEDRAFASLRDQAVFAKVEIGDWGHSLQWPDDVEIGADSLWLEALSASNRADARRFLEWRLKHGLSLTKAAEALGLSRRMVAYYSNGEKPVPRTVLLACRGWEAGPSPRKARGAASVTPA
jgi:hypothetical protein